MQIDQDEIRGGYTPRRQGISRVGWVGIIALGVMLGGLMHDAVRVLIANAVAEYHLEQFRREQARLHDAGQRHQLEAEVARLRAQEAAERARRERECFYMKASPGDSSQHRSLLDNC